MNNEYLMFIYKYFLNIFFLKNFDKFYLFLKIVKVIKFFIRNFCLITSRFKSTLKVYRFSRIKLRQLGLLGLIFGFKKCT